MTGEILKYFKGDTPRQSQVDILLEIEKTWMYYDVFIIVAPVAFGKSHLASCIAEWRGKATIITPNSMLAKQMQASEGLSTILNKSEYRNNMLYQKEKRALKGKVSVMNYTQYIANKAYNPTVIIDEAHNLVEFLREKGGVKLWGHLDGFEDGQFSSIYDLVAWGEAKAKLGEASDRVLKALRCLDAPDNDYTIREEEAMYRGIIRNCINIIPLSPRDQGHIIWPSSVKKLVLMSATFGLEDLYSLGLDNKRWCILEGGSPIPPEVRPIYFTPIGSMGQKEAKDTLVKFKDWLEALLDDRQDRGMIHITYALIPLVRRALMGSRHSERFLFHDKWDKEGKFKEWLTGDKVLFACGFWEGISLDYDKALWQVILKVPFPNLGDPVVYNKMLKREDSYPWETIKQVSQGVGRVCRRENDFGATFIIDSDLERLITTHWDLFPAYFREAFISDKRTS